MGLFDKMKKKKEKVSENGFINIEIKQLIDWNQPNGEGCIASDRITKEGWKVGYMYRESPMPSQPDSGWRFYKGDEDDEYSNNTNNHHVFAINTICNYDPDIISYLNAPIGTYLIRTEEGKFIEDDGTKPIYMEKQNVGNSIQKEE